MLTKCEEEIMSLLWQTDEPLTSSEIVEKSVNKTWKKSYINVLINSLLKKGMIKVVGIKQSKTNYARTFAPGMSKNAYAIKQITTKSCLSEDEIPNLFLALLDEVKNIDTLDEIEAMINKYRQDMVS